MKPRLLIVIVLAIMACCGTSLARFRRARTARPPPQSTNLYWTVDSVDTSDNKVTIQKGSSNITFSVSASTKITLSGKPAKLEDVTGGMKVVGRDMLYGSNLCNTLSVEPVQSKNNNKRKANQHQS